jgi:hypothetical protein
MELPVLLEPIDGTGFRARSGEPLVLTAEGSTKREALQNLQLLISKRLAQGAELVSLEFPPPNPLMMMAGSLKDNPLYDEWVEAIEEYRRKVDEEDGLP